MDLILYVDRGITGYDVLCGYDIICGYHVLLCGYMCQEAPIELYLILMEIGDIFPNFTVEMVPGKSRLCFLDVVCERVRLKYRH